MRMAAKTLAFFHPRENQRFAVFLGVGVTCDLPKGPATLGFGQCDWGQPSSRAQAQRGMLVSCFLPLPSWVWQWAGLFGGTPQSRGPVYPLCRAPDFSQLDFPFPHILQAPAFLGSQHAQQGL